MSTLDRWRTKKRRSHMSQHARPLRHQTEGLITKRGEPPRDVKQIWMLLQSTADELWVKWPFKASAAHSEEASHQSSWRSNGSTSRHFSAGHRRARGAGITHQSLRHWWWRRPPRPQICDWKDGTTRDYAVLVDGVQNTNVWLDRRGELHTLTQHTLCVCVKKKNKSTEQTCLSRAHTSYDPPFGAS